MSQFRVAPKVGHLAQLKPMYGYVLDRKHAAKFPDQVFDWSRTVYGDVHELLPDEMPVPLGNPVVHTTYVDANLVHDMTTGKSVTGIVHFVNKTIIHSYTKKQPLVESATYGSEFMAARTATEPIIELRATLRYLGVGIKSRSYLFGDNKTVVDSGTIPSNKLNKRHVIVSYHRVREAIAAKIMYFLHIPGSINPADILSKTWGYSDVWNRLKALLFWEGDTMDIE